MHCVIKTRVLDNKMLEKNKISLDIVGTERIFNNIQWQNSVPDAYRWICNMYGKEITTMIHLYVNSKTARILRNHNHGDGGYGDGGYVFFSF
jgi:hypothetical protein